MESYLPVFMSALALVFVVTQFVMLTLIAKSIREHKRDHLGDERMNNDLRSKSTGIIQIAQEKANDILADAEKKGVAILAQEESAGKNLSGEYTAKLTQIETEFHDELNKNAQESIAKLTDLISQSGHAMNDHITQSDKIFADKTADIVGQVESILAKFTEHAKSVQTQMEDKSNQMMDETRKMFENLATQTRDDIKKQMEGEFALAKAEIDQYKQSRINVINERIVEMLEEILTVTLSKKMTLSDQSELVYQALEEAKREHMFEDIKGKINKPEIKKAEEIKAEVTDVKPEDKKESVKSEDKKVEENEKKVEGKVV
jgi:hypothetical protein